MPHLRSVPVNGVNFLAADIAEKERGVIRGKSGPLSQLSPVAAYAMEADEALEFVVGDPDAKEVGIFGKSRIEVNVLTIVRPTGIADWQAH